VIGPDAGDGYTQHYFDSRGIARLYAMTFDGRDRELDFELAYQQVGQERARLASTPRCRC